MPTKKIVINPFDPESFKSASKEMENLQKKIDEGCETLVSLLAEIGMQDAQVNFDKAIYAGDNPEVSVYTIADKTPSGFIATVRASGENVGFIEFGTGILQPMPSPEAIQDYETVIPAHGTYGKGKAMNPKGWAYYGGPGNAPGTYEVKPGVSRTIGNPANSCMHNAYLKVQEEIARCVKEAFKI